MPHVIGSVFPKFLDRSSEKPLRNMSGTSIKDPKGNSRGDREMIKLVEIVYYRCFWKGLSCANKRLHCPSAYPPILEESLYLPSPVFCPADARTRTIIQGISCLSWVLLIGKRRIYLKRSMRYWGGQTSSQKEIPTPPGGKDNQGISNWADGMPSRAWAIHSLYPFTANVLLVSALYYPEFSI